MFPHNQHKQNEFNVCKLGFTSPTILGFQMHPQSRSLLLFALHLLRGLSIRQPATFDHLLFHHEQPTLMRPKSLWVHLCEKFEAEVEWYQRTKSKTKGQHCQNC